MVAVKAESVLSLQGTSQMLINVAFSRLQISFSVSWYVSTFYFEFKRTHSRHSIVTYL